MKKWIVLLFLALSTCEQFQEECLKDCSLPIVGRTYGCMAACVASKMMCKVEVLK